MTVRRLFALLLFVAIFTMAVRETLDPDMWWHLRTGQIILEEGIPNQDIYSYTVPGREWITHEWLSELFMALVYEAGGMAGLILSFTAIVTLTYYLLYLRCDGRPYLAAAAVLLGAFSSLLFWGVRPQMMNMLMAAAFIYLVEGFKDGRLRSRALWLLPFLTAVWANLHSGYLLGIVMLAVYCFGEALQRGLGRPDRRGLTWPQIRRLSAMTGLSLLAALLNPNGIELWIYPFFTLGSRAMQQHIFEWQSPNFHSIYFWFFALMAVIGILSWLFNRQRPALTDVLLFLGTAGAGLISARHIPLFSVVATPIVARYLLRALDVTPAYSLLSGRQPETAVSGLMQLLNYLVLGLALLMAIFWSGQRILNNDFLIEARYPAVAVEFLQREGLDEARGYHSYVWGGYLIWHDIPVYVDGRADVYGDEFLFRYLQTAQVRDNWQAPLDEYGVDYVLMEQSSPLTTLLAVSPDWTEVYVDDVAQIFVRAGLNR